MLRLGENEAEYVIWARDYDYTKINVVEDWQSLNIVMKWDDISSWVMELPTKEYMKRWDLVQSTPASSLLTPNRTMSRDPNCPHSIMAGHLGIMVFRNPGAGSEPSVREALFTGIITEVSRDWTGGDDRITLTGESDAYWLRTRSSYPDPRHYFDNGHHWWTDDNGASLDAEWVYEDETVEYVSQNIVSENMCETGYNDDLSYRWVPYFSTYWPWHDSPDVNGDGQPDGLGQRISYSTRFESCYDAVKAILALQDTSYGVAPDGRYIPISYGFGVPQISETAAIRIEYQFLIPEDKKSKVIFGTEFGNVRSFNYTERRPDYNQIIGGGPDYGAGADDDTSVANDNRQNHTVYGHNPSYNIGGGGVALDGPTSPSIRRYGRIESFESCQTGIKNEEEGVVQWSKIWQDLANETLTLVNSHEFNQLVKIDLIPEEMDQFIDQFNMGDYITVDLGTYYEGPYINTTAQRYSDFIREINISISPEGEIITPSVSDPMKWLWSMPPSHKRIHEHERHIKRHGRRH